MHVVPPRGTKHPAWLSTWLPQLTLLHITFVQDLLLNTSGGGQTDIKLLDFSKTFDKVQHRRLLTKLHYYGIRSSVLKWIVAFLTTSREGTIDGEALNRLHSSKVWNTTRDGTRPTAFTHIHKWLSRWGSIQCEVIRWWRSAIQKDLHITSERQRWKMCIIQLTWELKLMTNWLDKIHWLDYSKGNWHPELCLSEFTCGFPEYQEDSLQNPGQTKPGLCLYSVGSLHPNTNPPAGNGPETSSDVCNKEIPQH